MNLLEVWAAGGQNLRAVRENIERAMDELSPAVVQHLLGGTLTGAQNEAVYTAAEGAAQGVVGWVIASEVNDKATCSPCREIHGTVIGTTEDLDEVRRHYPAGGYGGYVACKGRERCRGTIRVKWPANSGISNDPSTLFPEAGPDLDPDDPDLWDLEPDDDALADLDTIDDWESELADMADLDDADLGVEDDQRPVPVEDRPLPPPPRHRRADPEPEPVEDRPKPPPPTRPRKGSGKVTERSPLADRTNQLRADLELESDATAVENRSGVQGLTEVKTLPNGRKVVTKRPAAGADDLDREELAHAVADAVGADVPAMIRDGDRLAMEFIDADDGFSRTEQEIALSAATPEGRSAGVLDVLIGNTDRHHANFFVRPDSGTPVLIDHGYAWMPDPYTPGTLRQTDYGPFSGQFLDPDDRWAGSPELARTNDLDPDQVSEWATRLEQLRPRFEELGRGDWLDFSLDRLSELRQSAERGSRG